MLQLTLGLAFEPEHNSEDFIITNANVEAFRAVINPHLWSEKRLLIIGDAGSGKTHLADIFMANNPTAITIENIETICQEELFHSINAARNSNTLLLLTSSTLPAFTLNDLKSRINATHKILIKPADDFLLKVIIRKQFSDRQISIKDEVIDYIMTHSERSYKSIKKLVSDIDRLSLAAKRNITIPLVKNLV